MQIINFNLKKDKKTIINKKNVKCLENNEKIIFTIDKIKYIYKDFVLIRETPKEIITLDFNNKITNIYLKDYKKNLYLNLYDIKIKKNKKIIQIEYKIETDINIINIITIEYIKK